MSGESELYQTTRNLCHEGTQSLRAAQTAERDINLDDDFGRVLAEKYRGQLTVYGYSTTADIGALESCADFIVYAKSLKATKRGFEI